MEEKRTVLVFGTFDGLHDGHRFFLSEARKLGERLVAVVAQDSIVEKIKGYSPVFPLQERLNILMENNDVDEVAEGDEKLGNWSAVNTLTPDIVAVGYDQKHLSEKLTEFIKTGNLPTEIIVIGSLEPDRLHSRFLR